MPLVDTGAAVESRVSGVIGGVKVSGYVDLLVIEGRIIDSKSALKPSRESRTIIGYSLRAT